MVYKTPSMVVAEIFRRVREARELGERHANKEEEIIMDKGKAELFDHR